MSDDKKIIFSMVGVNKYTPTGKHIIKDILIALRSAGEAGLEMPGLQKALSLFEKAAARGWQECGTQVLYRLYCEE